MLRHTYFFLCILFYTLAGLSDPLLPTSINIVSGVPLTLPEYALESMGLKPHENTGGWGDVMSNVGMALEIKKQFPEVSVRLIVTLNDQDTRQYVNRVRDFIPKILKNDLGEPYLNPDSRETQLYRGVEIYFISVPLSMALADPANLKISDRRNLEKMVGHVPEAEMALQFSANDSAFSNIVTKGRKMHLYFEEYSGSEKSHAYSFLRKKHKQIKLNAGPLGFGIYGFGSKDDARGGTENKKYLQSWLVEVARQNTELENLDKNLANYDLAFAYAGDAEMVEDYVKAIRALAKQKANRPTIIVYKGSGPVVVKGKNILIPLGAHPKELAQALISEATYSPLVTGDGSLSSALETTTETKSFLYEKIDWKLQAMNALIDRVFSKDPSLSEMAQAALVPQTKSLKLLKLSRKKRVEMMMSAISNTPLHQTWHRYFSRRSQSLNIADNIINMFQFQSVFESLRLGFENGYMYSDEYLSWLTELAKSFSAQDGFPKARLIAELNDSVYGKSKNLVEKWYALFTIWELGANVPHEDILRVIEETASFVSQKKTTTQYENSALIFSALEQINGSQKSKFAIYQAIAKSRSGNENFAKLRTEYKNQIGKNLRLSRKSMCETFYSY